jgi:HAD superfamily hydrolase (TIGR01450 family)
MDGVLFHGERPLPDAARLLRRIGRIPHLFVTNNPILAPVEVVKKFVRIGLPAPRPEQILTSAEATAAFLQQRKPGFRYFAVGAGDLNRALANSGRADMDRADFVVVGEGAGLDYRTLSIGINLILKRGAALIATNPDTTVDAVRHDGEHWVLPGGGALVAPFAAATGVEPVLIGKPHPLLFQMALDRLGATATECLMIGDRPDTDILGAQRFGMRAALVRTGRFGPGEPLPHGCRPPDWDSPDLTGLMERLEAVLPPACG